MDERSPLGADGNGLQGEFHHIALMSSAHGAHNDQESISGASKLLLYDVRALYSHDAGDGGEEVGMALPSAILHSKSLASALNKHLQQ